MLLTESALALVNPALQPGHLAERHNAVVSLEVAGFEEGTNTYTFDVKELLLGEFAPKTVTVSLPKTDEEEGEDPAGFMLPDGSLVTAFVSRVGRRGADEALLYVGNREWHEAKFKTADSPDQWVWTAKSPEAMSGTFNGDPARLVDMMRDIAADTYFFPVQAHTRFAADQVVAEFDGPLSGVGIYDLDGDGKPDIIAGTPQGVRLFLQQEGLKFEDATTAFGLEGVKATSISIADVDADGKADLLLDGIVFLARDGKFASSDLMPALPEGRVHASGFAEINGDGYPDVLIALKEGGLSLYLNPGKAGGSFTDASEAAGLREEQANPKGTGYFAAGDWNGDSRTDLYFGAGRALVLEQDEAGRFSPAPGRLNIDLRDTTEFKEGLTGGATFGALWDGGSSDLAVPTDSRIALLIRRDGNTTDMAGQGNEIGVVPGGLWGSVAEDLSVNGEVDLFSVTRRESESSNVFHLNRGYGSFMFPERYETVFSGKSYTTGAGGVAAGDLNGDGANDLVLGGLDGRLVLSLNETLQLRTPVERPGQEQAKLLSTGLLTVIPRGNLGMFGADIRLENASGGVVARRVLGTGMPSGSRGPDVVNFAVREPGDYTLTVRFSDGATQSKPVTVTAGERLVVELPRE